MTWFARAFEPIVPRMRGLRRSIAFRLTAYYGLIFAVCLVAAWLLIDRGLSALLTRSDRSIIRNLLKDLKTEYRTGIEGMAKSIGSKHSSVAAVRIADARNHTVAYFGPDWSCHNAIEMLPLTGSDWSRIRAKDLTEIDIGRGKLFDGSFIQVARSDRPRRQVMRNFERVSLAAIVPMLILATLGGALLAARTLRPIRDLNEAVREIGVTGKTSARLQSSSTAGELRDLVAAFNEMLARIEGLIETLKGTLDNVAHDLRTPLSRLRGIAELALQRSSTPEALRDALADCVEESERVTTLLNTIMDITEVESGTMNLQLQRVDLRELADQVAELYQQVAEDKGVELKTTSASSVPAQADRNRVLQALANLVDNAVKYTPVGGSVEVAAVLHRSGPALRVTDTGLGIPPEEQSRIWERLYRSDHSRTERGLGLGLSLVRAIMQAHLGTTNVTSSPGAGSIFTLTFPRETERSRSDAKSPLANQT